MTTDQLTGRALDEAAARAIHGENWYGAPQSIEAMMAWLHERGIVNIASSRKVCEVRHMSTPEMVFTPGEGAEWVRGTDLREALERLVVAVAAREATDGK